MHASYSVMDQIHPAEVQQGRCIICFQTLVMLTAAAAQMYHECCKQQHPGPSILFGPWSDLYLTRIPSCVTFPFFFICRQWQWRNPPRVHPVCSWDTAPFSARARRCVYNQKQPYCVALPSCACNADLLQVQWGVGAPKRACLWGEHGRKYR